MKGSSKLLLLAFCATFIPYFILAFHAHPAADDFTRTPSAPFWESQLDMYLLWNGRYTANFMVMCNPLLFGSMAGYRFISILLILLVPLSVFLVLSSIVERTLSISYRILISLITAALILTLLPSLSEGIYWYTGSVTYLLGCIITMFYIGTIARYLNQKFIIHPLFHACLCIVLLFLACGFNEVQMILLLVGHFVLLVSLKKQDRFHSLGPILVLFCLLFSSFILLSPGNHFRDAHFTSNHHFFSSFAMSFLQVIRFFFIWISYAPLLLAGILFAPISIKLSNQVAFFQKLGRYNSFVVFSSLWVILFICIFPAYWSTGILGQHRTLNTACFFFVPAWFAFLHVVYSKNNIAKKITQVLNDPIKIMLGFLLAASILFSGNSGNALTDIVTGKASAFDKEMTTRYAILNNAKRDGLTDAYIPVIQNKPTSLFILDINKNYQYQVNKEYANFFGLNRVCIDTLQKGNGQ